MGSLIKVLFAIILIGLSWVGEAVVLMCLYAVYVNLEEIPLLFALVAGAVLMAMAILLVLPTVYTGKTVIEFFTELRNKLSGKETNIWKP